MLTGVQIRMARAELTWKQTDLASGAAVHKETIARIERGEQALSGTLSKIEAAFERAGICIEPNGAVRLTPSPAAESAPVESGSAPRQEESTSSVGVAPPAAQDQPVTGRQPAWPISRRLTAENGSV